MLSDSVDERTCPACKQIFKKISGRNSHLKQARKCAWYNRQLFEFPEDSDCETDNIEQSGGTGDEIANDSVLDTDISLEEEVGDRGDLEESIILQQDIMLSAIDSPEEPVRKKRKIDDSCFVHDYHPLAGRIFRIDECVRDANAKYLSGKDGNHGNSFGPFHSETDWEMAQWLIEEDIGKLSGDRLMGIKKALLQYFSAAKF